MRDRFGADHARANGYVADWFFLREQAFLIPKIKPGKVLDVACGSGLMLQPLNDSHEVIGIDFNNTACQQALLNRVNVVRGDAFSLPFEDASFDVVTNCQFFNQQPTRQVELMIREAGRVLKPGGHMHLMWRGAHTVIHRFTYGLISLVNYLVGRPNFPQFDHMPDQIMPLLTDCQLSPGAQRMTLPVGAADVQPNSVTAKIFGASHYLMLEKRD